MNRIGLALLLVVCSQTLQAADEAPLMPTTPPPKVAIAKATDNAGRVVIALDYAANGEGVACARGRSERKESRRRVRGRSSRIRNPGDRNGWHAKVFDRNGVVVDPRTLPLLLKNDTPVLLTPDGKLDRFFRQLYRDEILVIAWPDRKEARASVPLCSCSVDASREMIEIPHLPMRLMN